MVVVTNDDPAWYETRNCGANSTRTWRHAPHGGTVTPSGPAIAIAANAV
jgi:hypothetical protein